MLESSNGRTVRAAAASAVGRAAASIPRTETRVMRSRNGGRLYRIYVYTPEGEPPPAGYPIVYALDANSVIGTFVEAVRTQGRRPERTGVVPAVIVGIGYETDQPFSPARYYDFTLTDQAELSALPGGAVLPEQGGAQPFLAFIEEELKTAIEGELPIDAGQKTLFGHSLGGLFVLHALFTKPDAFRFYVAGSPSIHWNKSLLLEAERRFVRRVEAEPADVDLLLASGELERGHRSGMTDNAVEMANRLASLADHGVRVTYKEFEGEGHVSVLPALISRTLRFALRPMPRIDDHHDHFDKVRK